MIMLVGVYSPVLNWCGGAEWVTLNIVNALKEQGHQVITLSDKPLDKNKFEHVFNKKINVDQQIVFPLRLFSPSDYHNLYIDALKMAMLKFKCEILIDTYSNAMLPIADVSYVHHPLLKLIQIGLSNKMNKMYFFPYQNFLKTHKEVISRKLIIANSKFTAEVISSQIGIDPYVLYPPVSREILNHCEEDFDRGRKNNVITISRICGGKNLEIIPYIAKSTKKEISFTIVGLLDSERFLSHLLKLIIELKVSERVKILTNFKRDQLRELLLNSKAYLHPTISEHFGVSIIEGMASGCIPVVHNSGGPKEFVPRNQRFNSVEEAVEIVEKVTDNWSPTTARKVSKYAERFSEDNFSKLFIRIFESYYLDTKLNLPKIP